MAADAQVDCHDVFKAILALNHASSRVIDSGFNKKTSYINRRGSGSFFEAQKIRRITHT